MTDGRTTSAGLWRYASEYANAAAIVANAKGNVFFAPLHFLLGRSIELSLKGFLLARGTNYSELRGRNYGHDLAALLREARRRRLGSYCKLQPRQVKAINLLNEQYATKRHEYIVTGTFSAPETLGLHLTAGQLVRSLEVFCINATYPGLRT